MSPRSSSINAVYTTNDPLRVPSFDSHVARWMAEDRYIGVELCVDHNRETLRIDVHKNGFFDRRVDDLRLTLETSASSVTT